MQISKNPNVNSPKHKTYLQQGKYKALLWVCTPLEKVSYR